MSDLTEKLGLSSLIDICITSADVGVEKPNPAIFKAALDSAKVSANEAIHVGDQHKSDVLGAKSVVMHAILLDREGYSGDVDDCPIVQSLVDIRPLLLDGKVF